MMLYNSLTYKDRPVKLSDYINNKYDKLHAKMYQDALSKYLTDYVNKHLSGRFTYRLFELLTSYFNIHNRKNGKEIKLDEILNYDKFNVISLINIPVSDIEDYILDKDFVNDLANTLYDDVLIKRTLYDDLRLSTIGSTEYIKYVFVNIMYMLHKLKHALQNSRLSEIANVSNISDFIIIYKNVSYFVTEDSESGTLKLIANEEMYDTSNIVFIGEELFKKDVHIGYNEEGKWILDISNEIDLTDEDIYNILYGLITKTNYNLWNLLIDNIKNMFLESHRIIEIKREEYWQSSSILIITRTKPYKKYTVDLTPYWNTYQAYNNLNIDKIMATIDDNLVDAKINYIDYVRGKTTIYSKHFDKYTTVDLNYIHANSEMDDESTLANTFTYKLNNNNQ